MISCFCFWYIVSFKLVFPLNGTKLLQIPNSSLSSHHSRNAQRVVKCRFSTGTTVTGSKRHCSIILLLYKLVSKQTRKNWSRGKCDQKPFQLCSLFFCSSIRKSVTSMCSQNGFRDLCNSPQKDDWNYFTRLERLATGPVVVEP